MIKSIEIKNFKSHKHTDLQLGNLSVLCGQNGVGKSSLIQSFLLLRQTESKNRLDTILDLNSPLCFIGKTKDALYLYPDKEENLAIQFRLSDGDIGYTWTFDASNESTFLNRINPLSESDGYESLPLFGNLFQYISAARAANYQTDNYAVEVMRQISISQGKGELTAQFLEHYAKRLRVDSALLHSMESDPYLLSQTTAWEREISTGVNVIPISIGSGYEVRFSFNDATLGETDHFSSDNVGFGLSYALPIIVAILSAEPGALLLIENPEAHLHPYGQSKIAELICLAAQLGIQILVETHSDHIINGILVQCKRFESYGKGIDKDLLRIYSFERDEEHHVTVPVEVSVGSKGRLMNRPNTFFDQIGRDIKYMIN
ncbi:DUF3696 domain-containing protein [Dyadobacter sp. CY343]|uniref:AAA family ATPase n=1 Tax=Dyadobacter sp. CY343 TaxID=2907299 RepID=UPI001F269E42|nr:AAA family ATPase [Dyadobacter sp. CY343]MCE7060660.1 AAA family ATPase [Dyadobacter sp. CY343]